MCCIDVYDPRISLIRYNEISKEIRQDPPEGSLPGAARSANSAPFLRDPRNPTKLEYDPGAALSGHLRNQVPGSVWKVYHDEESNKDYYYSRETRKSQWDHPHKDRMEAAERARLAVLEDGGWMECYTKDKKGTFWFNVTTRVSQWQKPERTDGVWVECTTEDEKDKYWWNKITKESSWTRPESTKREPVTLKNASYHVHPLDCGRCDDKFGLRFDPIYCEKKCLAHVSTDGRRWSLIDNFLEIHEPRQTPASDT